MYGLATAYHMLTCVCARQQVHGHPEVTSLVLKAAQLLRVPVTGQPPPVHAAFPKRACQLHDVLCCLHLMMFSWLLRSCRNIISRKVRCTAEQAKQSVRKSVKCSRVLTATVMRSAACSRCCCLTTSAPAVLAHLSVCCVLEGIKNLLQGH